jgi:Protein of unknown function (DUF3800)
MENTHIIYSDESNHTFSKFGSVCLVSGLKEEIFLLEKELKDILKNSNVKEFKFNEINSAKMIHCGIKIIDKVMKFISFYKLKIDIIIWSKDERTKVLPDKPRIVFERMYYHLLNNVLGKKWSPNSSWDIYPDEQSLIDWEKMKEILENTGRKIKMNKGEEGGHIFEIICKNNICKIQEISSEKNVVCQIADLFAGIGATGHLSKSNLTLHDDKQKSLGKDEMKLSNRDIGKIRIISYLRKRCRDKGFKIDFSPNKGIRTLDPQTPINFWVFEHKMQRDKNKKLNKWF